MASKPAGAAAPSDSPAPTPAASTPASAQTPPTVIGEFWPRGPGDPPLRPRPVHWLLAIPVSVLAMVLPRRLGPHLAASGWLAAYLVHFFCTLYAIGTVFAVRVAQLPATGATPQLPTPSWSLLWAPLAGVALAAYWGLDSWLIVGAAALCLLWWLIVRARISWFGVSDSHARGVVVNYWLACMLPIALLAAGGIAISYLYDKLARSHRGLRVPLINITYADMVDSAAVLVVLVAFIASLVRLRRMQRLTRYASS